MQDHAEESEYVLRGESTLREEQHVRQVRSMYMVHTNKCW